MDIIHLMMPIIYKWKTIIRLAVLQDVYIVMYDLYMYLNFLINKNFKTKLNYIYGSQYILCTRRLTKFR